MDAHVFDALMMVPREGGNPMMILLIQMLLFGVIFYYLLIRPQKKQQAERQAMLAAIKRGDEVITNGGLIGKVTDVKDDRITIRTGESTVVADRVGVARVLDGKASE